MALPHRFLGTLCTLYLQHWIFLNDWEQTRISQTSTSANRFSCEYWNNQTVTWDPFCVVDSHSGSSYRTDLVWYCCYCDYTLSSALQRSLWFIWRRLGGAAVAAVPHSRRVRSWAPVTFLHWVSHVLRLSMWVPSGSLLCSYLTKTRLLMDWLC